MGGISGGARQDAIMGDADDSYDWSALSVHRAKLRANDDFVMGRLPAAAARARCDAVAEPLARQSGAHRPSAGCSSAPGLGFPLRSSRLSEGLRSAELRTTGMEFAAR